MSFFKKIFGGGSSEPSVQKSTSTKSISSTHKTLSFGRYTDCNKTADQLAHWDRSVQAFNEKRYVDSFESFLHYLKDPLLNNVKIERKGDVVEFELIQGSNIISGFGNNKEFVAQTNVAEMQSPSIPVMRKLMAINYGLLYSKFALNGTAICMKFSSHAIDASGGKLYAALKELSKKADQQDDLLISEFSSLTEIGDDHLISSDPSLVEIKYKYLLKWVNETKAEVAKMDLLKDSGGIAFLLLELTYKIDYLIVPQGVLTNSLERIQMEFFKKGDATTAERNAFIMKEFDTIISEPKEKILEGIYDVKCTFGIANSAAHKTVMDMMFKEREKVAWYRDNGYPQVERAVYGYMVSYAFFNYGMVYPVTSILNIAMHVLNADYYKEMGDENQYVNADNTLNGKNIIRAIDAIIANAKKDYSLIYFNTSVLNFSSVPNFVDSLIVELDKINLVKNKK